MSMSIQRCDLSLRSSALRLGRIAASLAADRASTKSSPIPSICIRCYGRRPAHFRALSTLTEYKPYSLDPSSLSPPRNKDIPDTSIAGPQPQLVPKTSARDSQPRDQAYTRQEPPLASISLPESEAQKSKPISTPTPSKGKTLRASKLRPRKAAMSLTPTAVLQLRNLLDQPEPKFIRVGVKNRGCSGLAYSLEYVDKPGAFDEAVEQDGVKVLVDSKALFSIIGSEMDWVEDKLEERFVFKNPNIKEQCGCGESFMV